LRINRRWINFYKQGQRAIELAMSTFWARCRPDSHAIYLTHNPDENRKIIQQALELPEEELLKRSQAVREQVAREHRWEDIYGKIWHTIQADIEERKSRM